MATKQRSKKKGNKKTKRVGALNPNNTMIKLAAIAVGYFVGDTINGPLDKIIPASVLTPTNPTSAVKYVPAVAQIGIGGLLLMKKGKPSMIKTIAGGLLAGSGLRRGLKSAGVITGYQSTPVIGKAPHRMAGYQTVPVVGNVPAQLQGIPAQLQGYRVNGPGYTPAGSGVGVMGRVNGISDNSSGSGITNTDGSSYMS